MIVVSWNCRGLGSPRAVRSLWDVILSHRPQVIGLIETKKSCKAMEFVRCKTRMKGCFAVGRRGLAGRLAVLWKDGVDVSIRNFSSYHIDMKVSGETEFNLSLFYGDPVHSKRAGSWKLLEWLSRDREGPWVVMGDFNEVMFSKEAIGKNPRDSNRMRQFRDTINRCDLSDLGFTGALHTFSNKRKFPEESRARLDRFLVNGEWKTLFGNAVVMHSSAITSDHVPIVLDCHGRAECTVKKDFRFEAMWQGSEGFRDLLRNSWMGARGSENSLSNLQSKCASSLSKWNRSCFGNVQRKIKDWKRKLDHIRGKCRTEATSLAEKEILDNIDEWLSREELLWKQRSKVEWLKEGDSNTAFFHAKATQRRATNRIKELVADDRIVVKSEEDMMKMCESYFNDLFDSSVSASGIDWQRELTDIPRKVSEPMREKLREPYTATEVRTTLFQMSPLKAPGIDGFPAAFYQRNWSIVGEDVCRFALKYLNEGKLEEDANITKIILIPKKKKAATLQDFRPISLVNVTTKIISKVLANRIQDILPDVVSPSQSAFVRGRLISDNVLIAHEVSHAIKKGAFSGSIGLSLKLDMSKAFDRIESIFLEHMLLKLGFSGGWVTRVMGIFRKVRYKV